MAAGAMPTMSLWAEEDGNRWKKKQGRKGRNGQGSRGEGRREGNSQNYFMKKVEIMDVLLIGERFGGTNNRRSCSVKSGGIGLRPSSSHFSYSPSSLFAFAQSFPTGSLS
ncbi:hypothetical protein J1N35_001886 [Gossypium stocksii]|uniref:Uncharacterized protein n=1 Tax=Gossypium stocksii TaxID=47602 RepID=A0A9D3WKQ7_9ROSI|nr:hypothetical protein J1N35_001886 [Gossypium stocksii]